MAGPPHPDHEAYFPVQPHTYEIAFTGQADRTLRAQFDDCEVITSPETTTLHADLADQAALPGLIERIVGLGLEIIDVHLVTQPPAPAAEFSCGSATAHDPRDTL